MISSIEKNLRFFGLRPASPLIFVREVYRRLPWFTSNTSKLPPISSKTPTYVNQTSKLRIVVFVKAKTTNSPLKFPPVYYRYTVVYLCFAHCEAERPFSFNFCWTATPATAGGGRGDIAGGRRFFILARNLPGQ